MTMQPTAQSPDHARVVITGVSCFTAGVVLGVWLGTLNRTPPPERAPAPVAVAAAAQPTAPTPAVRDDDTAPPPEAPAVPRSMREDLALAQMIEGLSGPARGQALCGVEQRANREIRYALLERSPARFAGSIYVASGRAIQVQDIDGEPGAFVLVSMDSYGSQIVALATYTRPSDEVVADRRVRFYGRVVGTYTYETRGGQTMTVPKVHAVAVVPAGRAPDCGR